MKERHNLHVSLAPSRIACSLVLVSSVATAALIGWLPVAAAVRSALVVFVGVYAIVILRHWAVRSASHAIVGIELDVNHAVCLTDRAGRRIEGALRPDSYVGALLTTIVVRPQGKRRLRSTAILPDMLPSEDFRRLRVLLRMGHADVTATSSPPIARATSADHR